MVEAVAVGTSCPPAEQQQQSSDAVAAAAGQPEGAAAQAAAEPAAADGAAQNQESAPNPEAAAAAGAAAADGDGQQKGERLKPKPGRKRKVAMHLAYLGAGYHGMQRNPGCPTIEAELESALVKAGAISDQNAGSFMKIHWMRAARTDKGVSAACQVVSAKLVVDPVEPFVERVNALLPQQIRVFGVQRATEGFDARKFCDKRKYEYILPAWAFDPAVCSHGRPPSAGGSSGSSSNAALQAMAAAVLAAGGAAGSAEKQSRGDSAAAAAAAAEDSGGGKSQGAAAGKKGSDGQPPAAAAAAADEAAVDDAGDDVTAPAAAAAPPDESAASCHFDKDKLERIRAEVAASKARFVFGPEQLSRLNSILGQYTGTHNFHNYTVKVAATDPAARRFIHSFQASLMSIGGEPWVKLVVVGQSFMLHQIRKMVGMALAVMRGVAAPECLGLALDPDRDMNTPMAPELGLFLDETYYDAFNYKWGDLHGPVTFEPFRTAAEQFKAQVLYPHIAAKDEKELINALWLRNCTNACYKFTKWAKWAPVRNMAAMNAKAKQEAAAKRGARNAVQQQQQQQQQGKRPADAAAEAAAAAAGGGDDAAAEQPAAKQQRLDRPGRLDGATAGMVVAMQETYGMSPHHDTVKAAGARKELKEMRQEYQQQQQQQQQEVAAPEQPLDPEAALDSLYDLM